MKRHLLRFSVVLLLFALFGPTLSASAEPDRYKGDTAIYSSSTEYLRPNVLFVIDNSAAMLQAGSRDPYDPSKTYTGTYSGNEVYERKSATGGNTANYVQYISDVNTDVSCSDAKNALLQNGFYAGNLKKSDGSCNASQPGNYYLGNLLNYIDSTSTNPTWAAGTTYSMGDKVEPTTPVYDSNGTALTFEVSGFTTAGATSGTSGAAEPTWPTTTGTTVTDGGVIWQASGSIIGMVKATVDQVVAGARDSVNFGVVVFGSNNKGGKILSPVLQVGSTDSNGPANYSSLTSAIDGISLLNANSEPVNEALWDSGVYYRGGTDYITSQSTTYSSPITQECQKNFVIVLTAGSANPSNTSSYPSAFGDVDGDGYSGYVDDAAKYLYDTDASSSLSGTQHVQTDVIQLLTPQDDRLVRATDGSHGNGQYYHIQNSADLTKALLATMANIVLEANTAFVAPVVPSSPENRTESGQRVYLGFFKPISQKPWYGNLKKYKIGTYNGQPNQILDYNGNPVFDSTSGAFNDTALSYWSSVADGGEVDMGGVGEQLLNQVSVSSVQSSRNIYTYTGSASLGTSVDLTASAQDFSTANDATLDPKLGLDQADSDSLIKYIYGLDSYDYDGDGVTDEKRDWILGDILHSKPLVVNYKSYDVDTYEGNSSYNNTYIFVGSNDGMLHCFKDVDGSEAWAFIPPGLLGDLQYLRDPSHSYFVDSSPVVYIHDANNDGTIESGDKVIIMFGTRRGGGQDNLTATGYGSTTDTRGAYYFLDVTDPTKPKYLGKIDSNTVDSEGDKVYPEMGETWSVPRLAKIKVGSSGTEKVVAFIGAGYDNNEDLRFGNTQSFPSTTDDSTSISSASEGFYSGKSADGAWQHHARGRGVYAVEIATLDEDDTTGTPVFTPSFTNIGHKVWGYTRWDHGSNTHVPYYSFPSDVAVLDQNHDGFADRLYVGDTGGNMWRFDVGSTSTADWTSSAKIVFSANPGTDDASGVASDGRKIFYPPAVTNLGSGTTALYFGTGDRAHPQNYLDPGTADGAVVDRFYMVEDRDNDLNTSTIPSPITESNLIDVTTDVLQQSGTSSSTVTDLLHELYHDTGDYTKYGWYIKLNARDGEKVLASPSIFNGTAYFTTYAPNSTSSIDPCNPGNLGTSRLYGVNPRTGEAVQDYYTAAMAQANTANVGKDIYGESQTDANAQTDYASGDRSVGQNADGTYYVLHRADREMTLGGGLPTGATFIMNQDGSTSAVFGSGGKYFSNDVTGAGTVFPLYWLQW